MDPELDQKRIITEQREQLMQLRTEIRMLKGGSTGSSGSSVSDTDLGTLFSLYKLLSKEGKTIGFKVPSLLRDRLNAVCRKYGAGSYRQAIMVCIELGLRQLETRDGTGSVETVQDVLRTNGSGNGGDPAASN